MKQKPLRINEQRQREQYAWWEWPLVSTTEVGEISRVSFFSNHSIWITHFIFLVKCTLPNDAETSTVLEQSVAAFKYRRDKSEKSYWEKCYPPKCLDPKSSSNSSTLIKFTWLWQKQPPQGADIVRASPHVVKQKLSRVCIKNVQCGLLPSMIYRNNTLMDSSCFLPYLGFSIPLGK